MRKLTSIACAIALGTASAASGIGGGPAAPVHFAPSEAVIGTTIQFGGSGEPGHAYCIAVSSTSGPTAFLPGLALDLGPDYAALIIGCGFFDGAGFSGIHPVPLSVGLLGLTGYSQMVTLALAPISSVQKSPVIATYIGDGLCTPAVISACLSAGFEACQPGSPVCGPELDPCTPTVESACIVSGFEPCTVGVDSADCGPLLPFCGDGFVDPGEQCDPPGVGCGQDCQAECTDVICAVGFAPCVPGSVWCPNTSCVGAICVGTFECIAFGCTFCNFQFGAPFGTCE